MIATVTQLPCDEDSAEPGELLWQAIETDIWWDAETEFSACFTVAHGHPYVILKARTSRGDVKLRITLPAQANMAAAITSARAQADI